MVRHESPAKSPREMFTQLLSQPPISLNKAKPGLTFPPVVEHVVMRALAKAPKDRFADVLEFARALQEALTAVGQPAEEDGSGLFSRMKGLFRSKS